MSIKFIDLKGLVDLLVDNQLVDDSDQTVEVIIVIQVVIMVQTVSTILRDIYVREQARCLFGDDPFCDVYSNNLWKEMECISNNLSKNISNNAGDKFFSK